MYLSPWVEYKFRVIAVNGVGPSLPSNNTDVYATNPAPPHHNPSNLKGAGTDPTNMIITWDAMPPEEHNAPGFMYILCYKPVRGEWKCTYIRDWLVSQWIVEPTEPFQAYAITIMTANKEGGGPTPVTAVGYSGEDGTFNSVNFRY
ncbi:neuronal cell adhesion molecule-like [Saccoglossus kowalevskii]